jgi:hypothetical protein
MRIPRRLIFSRKGFDSQYGGIPSPILPDGSLVSFPIPSRGASHSFAQLRWEETNLGALVGKLSGGRVHSRQRCHVDPDLDPRALPRSPGWRPIFGQANAAQRHLRNHDVREGDLFLFFGWFREVEPTGRELAYVRKAPHLHALFGWLQVGASRRITPELRSEIPWAAYHDHLKGERLHNHLYIAAERLQLGKGTPRLPGAGIFRRDHPALRLTAPGRTRSVWALPRWFFPANGRRALSYHGEPARWERTPRGVLLHTVGRGQEFVLHLDDYPQAIPWLRSILRLAAS